jgi:hypothetical protein
MRVRVAIAVLAFGVAGITTAGAADLGVGGGARGQASYGGYSFNGGPAGPVIVYGYEPGVVIRAYWLPPWRNRHYFPFHGKRPKQHATSYHGGRPKPAETYWRYWSNDGAFLHGMPPRALWSFDRAPAPRAQNHSTLVRPRYGVTLPKPDPRSAVTVKKTTDE